MFFTSTLLVYRNEASSMSSLEQSTSGEGQETSDSNVKGLIKIKNISYDPKSVLGIGCEGTKVCKGRFDERDVAVKILLRDAYKLAKREIELLRKQDQHSNVIRYYWNEKDTQFVYIALELCEGNLQDYVEDKLSKIQKLEPIELIHQMMKGLVYLHSFGIVHRDLKPHNILISRPGAQGEVRVLISDFGLSRQLPPGKDSFSATSGFPGTIVWAAPELSSKDQNKTFAVDIFSAGCVMYYVLTMGKHPFGDTLRDITIRIYTGTFSLDQLPPTSDGYIAKDIIRDMLSSDPNARPTANVVLEHLLFWNKNHKLRFLEATNNWIKTTMIHDIENPENKIFDSDWTKPLSQEVKDDIRNDTQYNTSAVQGLLRLIGNKSQHYYDQTADVQKSLGSIPDEYLDYFTSRFPLLLVHTYRVMKCCSKEDAFKAYYKHE
ncbi:hypothetical protein ACJMK2_038240 [Sinanodonta woodiana]|uniref:non-specific serine/threonine protein kinase n=2 Tax=Sinanodonta woodiana TaxID=1069815 RepID=A0ABD3WBI1_SINWO